MDDKTEELRDIFMDVADEETVTEEQEQSRGSLSGADASTERLGEVVAEMRRRYEFSTPLSDGELAGLVAEFYRGASDEDLAEELDVPREQVFRARLDLHLVRETDTDAPFDLADLRALLAEEVPLEEIADELDVQESAVRRYRRVLEARDEARRVSDRFRSEFEDALVEAGLSDQLTVDVTDDGLEEATDGMETDVSF